MKWPNRTEYAEAVRDYPDIALLDPKLKGGQPQLRKDGLRKDGWLISYNGGFSIVFPIDKGSRTFALRCWTQEVSNAQFRYEKISEYLKDAGLSYFVDFEYVPDGIFVNGSRYPITRMEWADGVSLRKFIERNLKSPAVFKDVADKFREMVADLHKHNIAMVTCKMAISCSGTMGRSR